MHPDDQHRELWNTYAAEPSLENQWRLVLVYDFIAQKQTWAIHASTDYQLERADIYTEAQFGLLDAVGRFEPERGLRFTTYAPQRVRGHLIDWLRQLDFLPRLARLKHNKCAAGVIAAQLAADHLLSSAEQAEAVGMTEEEHLDCVVNSRDVQQFSNFGDRGVKQRIDQDKTSLASLGDKEFNAWNTLFELRPPDAAQMQRDFWTEVCKGMSQQERLIVLLYYREGLSMKQIGRELGISESRVSQMHSALITRLKAKSIEAADYAYA